MRRWAAKEEAPGIPFQVNKEAERNQIAQLLQKF
jgi:hypothetical protein